MIEKRRFYRNWCENDNLVSFEVVVEESDLYITARRNLKEEAFQLLSKYRSLLQRYIEKNPTFRTTLSPFPVDEDAPAIVKAMAEVSEKTGTGPMAAVAGAIAEFVGRDLLKLSDEIIIENGGDIFMKTLRNRRLGIYAGNSPFSGRIVIEIKSSNTPLGICTSSGTLGHSLSFGKADAVVVISPSSPLADGIATAIGNVIQKESDILEGIQLARGFKEIKGILIIKNEEMGIWGDIEILEG